MTIRCMLFGHSLTRCHANIDNEDNRNLLILDDQYYCKGCKTFCHRCMRDGVSMHIGYFNTADYRFPKKCACDLNEVRLILEKLDDEHRDSDLDHLKRGILLEPIRRISEMKNTRCEFIIKYKINE